MGRVYEFEIHVYIMSRILVSLCEQNNCFFRLCMGLDNYIHRKHALNIAMEFNEKRTSTKIQPQPTTPSHNNEKYI